MKNSNRNIRILAENNGTQDGFNVFLDFSGRREYLTYHRHNGLLYALLKDGVALDDMRRWKPARMVRGSRRRSRVNAGRVHSMVSHLLNVVDDYLLDREAC